MDDEYEYEYEYDVSEDIDLYKDRSIDDVKVVREAKVFDDNWNNLKSNNWTPSSEVFSNYDLEQYLKDMGKYNQIIFKSWSNLINDHKQGNGGTILRFQHTKTHKKTDDFNLKLNKNIFINLRSNMDYLREEVQADLASIDLYKYGGVATYTAVTDDGSVQVIFTKLGNDFIFGYISFFDQLFVPIKNKFRLNEASEKSSLDLTQELTVRDFYDIKSIVQYQRKIGKLLK